MLKKIKIGILGYGNLGKGVEKSLLQNEDMELVAIFSRRPSENIKSITGQNVLHISEIQKYTSDIDVLILCGGSATDLPVQCPEFAKLFNTVDSFDTHVKIPEYFELVNKEALNNNKTSIISIGWDPGLFSLNRLISEAVLPDGKDYTFWGKGVSQGHSDAIRRVKGVKKGVQYTIPVENAINLVRSGINPDLTTRDKHLRYCYVVAECDANLTQIELDIKNMPNYFSDYETKVTFITEEEFSRDHNTMPHGGFVIRSGNTGGEKENNHIIEFSLKLSSNPEFTASVLVAYARAAHKLSIEGNYGAKTIFDIPISYLSPKSPELLRKELL